VDLVSKNLEDILGLKKAPKTGKKGKSMDMEVKGEGILAGGDFVVWEGNPLEFGGSVAVSVDGESGTVMDCWPDVQ